MSDDKDMKTIPGRLYRPMSDELLEITAEDADRYFLTQVLTGDTADGYKGVPWHRPEESRSNTRPPAALGRR